MSRAGVVDQDFRTGISGGKFGKKALHIGGIPRISHSDFTGNMVSAAKLPAQRFQRVRRVESVENQRIAMAGKGVRRSPADAAGCSGDQYISGMNHIIYASCVL